MLTLLTLTMLTAAPASGLTISAQLGKPNTPVDVFLDAIEQELLAVKLPVKRLALACDGQRDCLLKGAKSAALPALVAVSIAYSKKQATLDLEGMRVDDGVTVSQLTFPVTGKLTDADRQAVRTFGARLVEALTPVKTETKTDTPVAEVKPTLVPEPPKKDVPVVVAPLAPTAPRSRVPAYVLGGGAVASGVVSGVFLALATGTNAQLTTAQDNTLTRPQAQALVDQANAQYTVSLATGLAAGALAVAAVVWLVTE